MNQCNGISAAKTIIKGDDEYARIRGEVLFRRVRDGVLVTVRVSGLPKNESGFYGFHIHEGKSCEGEDFEKTKGHYNPKDRSHPHHAGDLPPLLSCKGAAFMQVKTDRFRICDIIGRTVVIHGDADDFRTQPSGDAGEIIACGVIRAV